MRRGDVRAALLIALQDGPGHGYELIQALETKTDGRWRPSPGSVYPLLQLLADEGLVTTVERDGKRVYELTDAGRTEAEQRVTASGLPWESMDQNRDSGGLRTAMRDLHNAARQVGMAGSSDTVAKATEIVTNARKELYRLLADS
jgi:DNA-binding PadR family transcriptional regulator